MHALIKWESINAKEQMDAYFHLKTALTQGDVLRAKKILKSIRSKLIRPDDRFLYFDSMVNFLNENYQQAYINLANLEEFTSSPYFGKICHLAWINALYLNHKQALVENQNHCTGILSNENNANLYWYQKVTYLKLDQLDRPWDSKNLSNKEQYLIYRPIGGTGITAQDQISHFRQWLKLNYFHGLEGLIFKYFYRVAPFIFLNEEVAELVNVIKNNSSELNNEVPPSGLNGKLSNLSAALQSGAWENATSKLELLWHDYPYSYKINSTLTLLYWLTGKTNEALFKIQHMQNSFQHMPSDLLNLSASVLMEGGKMDSAKQTLYLSHADDSDESQIIKQNIWQWIGIEDHNHNLAFQASTMACDLGDKTSCPLSYSYWRKTDEINGPPPSVDDWP